MTAQEIKQIHSTKKIKIFLLGQLGLKNADIAKELGTNAGHVFNVLKGFKTNPGQAEEVLKTYGNGS